MNPAVAIVIPAYKPGPPLVKLVHELRAEAANLIIVVDDGSGAENEEIFCQIKGCLDLVLLKHAVNLGKGAALKTALNYLLCEKVPCEGAITVDADGQHKVSDVIVMLKASIQNSRALILGVRDFEGSVPMRSRIGNKITQIVFFLLLGVTIRDTQTGLRYLPREFFRELLRIGKNRYEFELEVLLNAVQKKWQIQQIPIATIYLNKNLHSHFNPFTDSARIYFVFLRYVGLSLVTAILDNLVFGASLSLTSHILFSFILGRAIAGGFNFFCAKYFVFHSRGRTWAEGLRFLVLLSLMSACTYGLMSWVRQTALSAHVLVIKLCIETALFFLTFSAQRVFVFLQFRSKLH